MAYKNVYQFKITLEGIKPAVWRRIQVPETYTFWELHVAIQDSMGWTDTHLHAFRMPDPETGKLKEIGMPDDPGFSEFPVLAGWEVKLADWFSEKNNKVDYTYDFGDDWNHEVVLEKVLPKESGKRYPVCLDGKRACPPEDCGGVYGYERFLEIIKNPDDEEYKETMAWCDEDFDPDYFDCNEIKFDSPKKRLKYMFDF